MTLEIYNKKPIDYEFSILDVSKDRKLLIDWFKKKLDKEYFTHKSEQTIEVKVQFKELQKIKIRNYDYDVGSITFTAQRIKENRRKFLKISGDGFYDWNNGKLTVPPKGKFATEGFRPDFSDFEKFEGEIPPINEGFDLRFELFVKHFEENCEVINLEAL